MTDADEPLPSVHTATQDEASLRGIEQDLNHVDEALASLDAGDLDAAEALTAGLDSSGAPAPDQQRNGGEQEPAPAG